MHIHKTCDTFACALPQNTKVMGFFSVVLPKISIILVILTNIHNFKVLSYFILTIQKENESVSTYGAPWVPLVPTAGDSASTQRSRKVRRLASPPPPGSGGIMSCVGLQRTIMTHQSTFRSNNSYFHADTLEAPLQSQHLPTLCTSKHFLHISGTNVKLKFPQYFHGFPDK